MPHASTVKKAAGLAKPSPARVNDFDQAPVANRKTHIVLFRIAVLVT
jgi:hypothetical protein